MKFLYIFITLLIFMLKEISSIRLIKIDIPAYKLRNETAVLQCIFELNNNSGNINSRDMTKNSRTHNSYDNQNSDQYPNENEKLYSVKWYKDNVEFYRYMPEMNPPQYSYKVDGIKVNHLKSNDIRVTLENLRIKSSGLYRCEVSGEAPYYTSEQGEGRMEIVHLPKDGPEITGEKEQYQIGDELNLNCTSGKSHPSSLVQWFINDDLVVNQESLITYPDVVHPHGTITTIVGLQIILDVRHFHAGAMRVKCTASLSPVLWQGDKVSVVQGMQPAAITNREAMLLVRSASNNEIYNIFLMVTSMVILNILQTIPFL